METRIGQALRQARQARSLTLEQVSEALHIKPHYLQALEEGRWEDLPSLAQGRGFLRLYAAFLGLDLTAHQAGAALPAESVVAPAEEEPLEKASAGTAVAGPDQAEPAGTPTHDPALPIFAELGRALREQRERLGVSLDEAEQHTHVRRRNLEAMEAGRFDDLPSPVQARGMLQHYARFLQLDADQLLLRFADAIQARYRARQEQTRPARPLPSPVSWMPRLRLPERTLGLLLAGLAALFVVWGAWQVVRARAGAAPEPTPPSVLEVLFPTPSPTPTLPPFTATPTPASPGLLSGEGSTGPTPQASQAAEASNAPIQVYVIVRQRAYLRVVVDGEERLAERVLPGSTYFFGADARVELTTGNGAAIQVFYNQQDLGLLGRFGEAVTRVFTLNGVQTPTPLPSPTPTATSPVTPTPTPTSTPTATPPLP